jgi:hypothetical protein
MLKVLALQFEDVAELINGVCCVVRRILQKGERNMVEIAT